MSTGSGAQPEQRCRGGNEQWLQGQEGDEAAGAEGSLQGRLRDTGGKAGGELITKGPARAPEESDLYCRNGKTVKRFGFCREMM